jgi:hypothetical protein
VNNTKPVADCVEGMSKATSVVCAIHLSKTKQCVLQGPLSWSTLFDPVPCDSKIGISVARLPCIACQAYFPTNSGALMNISERKGDKSMNTHRKTLLEHEHLLLEGMDDSCACHLGRG